MRELGLHPADIPPTVRVCNTTLKNSCHIEYVLLSLKTDCDRLPIAGYDTEAVICGKWEAAILHTSHTHQKLLKVRTQWLEQVNSHAAVLWMTAHTHMAVWLRSHPTEPPPVRVYPRMHICMSTNILPDPRAYLLQLPLFQSTKVKTNFGNSKCMLTHLLNKCLPKRCQIRELARFIGEYCLRDPVVRLCLERILFCSLCSIYPHCKVLPSFNTVLKLTATLLFSRDDGQSLVSWLRNGNQAICMYAIREYLCFAVSTQPTLRTKLRTHFDWAAFETHTCTTTHHMRTALFNDSACRMHTLSRCAQYGGHIVEKTRIGLSIAGVIRIFARLRSKQLQRVTGAVSTLAVLVVEASRACTAVGVTKRMQELTNCPVAVGNALFRIHAHDTEAAIRTALLDLLAVDLVAYSLLEYELRDILAQQTLRVYPLPAKITAQQRRAVAVGTIETQFVYCTGCTRVANTGLDTSKARSHRMSMKVAIDDDASCLVCATSRKHAGNTRASTFDNTVADVRCTTQALTIIPLCGKIVETSHGIYGMCVECGRVMSMRTDMVLVCVRCLPPAVTRRPDPCALCHKTVDPADSRSVMCLRIHPVTTFETVVMCAACTVRVSKYTKDSITTTKQIAHFRQTTEWDKSLTIPGNRYNFFRNK